MTEYSAKVHKKSQSLNLFAVTSGTVLRKKIIQISICSQRQNKGLHSANTCLLMNTSVTNKNAASNVS